MLSDVMINDKIKNGEIRILPFNKNNIQPSSVDLTLAGDLKFLKPNRHAMDGPFIDLKTEFQYSDGHVMNFLPPETFALATTNEFIKLPNDIGAYIQGRSSIGRAGLFVENAGFVDPGFAGTITLELFNATKYPIQLEENMRICQIIFDELSTPCNIPYGDPRRASKYQYQRGVTGSRINQDREMRS